jgi:hypothetical protein
MTSKALFRYLEGEVTASERAEIETDLAGSATSRAELERCQAICSALREPDETLEGLDLLPAVHLAAREQGAPARRRFGLGFCAALAAVAFASIVFALGRLPEPPRAKSAAPAAARRWTAVQAFAVDAAGIPRQLGTALSARAGLAFAYSNLGESPFSHLMIFGVDAGGEVRWFHPAYERAGSDPQSIAIGRGSGVELAEVIRHDLPAGQLTIYSLFSRRPLHVLEVEAALRAHQLPFADTAQHEATVQVLP